jgi:uridine phosphorylase
MKIPEHDYKKKIPLSHIRRDIYSVASKREISIDEHSFHRTTLLALCPPALKLLIKSTDGREIPWIYEARRLFQGRVGGIPVNIIWAGLGGPVAAYVMEHLIAMGTKCFIGVGTAGSVQPCSGDTCVVLPIEAVRDEGTSYHYIPADLNAKPTEEVLDALRESCHELGVQAKEGIIWTIDAPHRETSSRMEYFRKQGVLAVDMESAAVFTVAMHRRVQAGCIILSGVGVQQPIPSNAMKTIVKIACLAARRLHER